MEQQLLQFILVFFAGLICGALLLLLWNKLSSGSASPSSVKDEYDEYKNQVEAHFEETSKKFQDMTEQYQGLYKHLSVGATSLCRPDSVAAGLADDSNSSLKLENKSTSVDDAENSKEKTESTLEDKAEPAADADSKKPESESKVDVKDPEQAKKEAAQAKVDKALGEETVKALKEEAASKGASKKS